MRLVDVPHRVLGYRTIGMDNPVPAWTELHSIVWLLVIEDNGEAVALVYRPPKKRPEWRHLIRAAAKAAVVSGAGAGVASSRASRPEHRGLIVDGARTVLDRWLGDDLKKAFAVGRGEGYYRADQPRSCYYRGMITSSEAASWRLQTSTAEE